MFNRRISCDGIEIKHPERTLTTVTPIIACTYAEIALKGRNRTVFLRKLINNITRGPQG